MCGIFGYARIKGNNEKLIPLRDFMTAGFPTSILRGMDGSGLYIGEFRDKSCYYYKRAITGSDFINCKTTKELLLTNPHIAVGHVRAKTRGAVKDENSHPFAFENLILVHNGTLTAPGKLEAKNWEVDSETIVQHLAAKGVEEGLKDIEGSFALAIYDHHNHQFYLIRNEERPLAVGWFEKGKGLIFASEYDHLYWLVNRNAQLADHVDKITELDPGQLVIVTDKIHTKKIKLKKRTYVQHNSSHHSALGGWVQNEHGVYQPRSAIGNNNRSSGTVINRPTYSEKGEKPKRGEVVIASLVNHHSRSPSIRKTLEDDNVVMFKGRGAHRGYDIAYLLSGDGNDRFSRYFKEEKNKSEYSFLNAEWRNSLWLVRVDEVSPVIEAGDAVEIPRSVTSYTALTGDDTIRVMANHTWIREWMATNSYHEYMEQEPTEDDEDLPFTADSIKEGDVSEQTTDLSTIHQNQMVKDTTGGTVEWGKIAYKFKNGCCWCAQPFLATEIYNRNYDWYNGEPVHNNCIDEIDLDDALTGNGRLH